MKRLSPAAAAAANSTNTDTIDFPHIIELNSQKAI